MVNGNEHDTKAPIKAGSQNPDSGQALVGAGDQDTPEGVVRRLLKAEGGGGDPAPPRQSPAAGKVRDNASKSPPRHSLAGRLSAAPRRALASMFANARKVLLSYRPRPRHIALLMLGVIVLSMPWLIPVLILLGLVMTMVSYLTLGHDRSAELIARWYGWLARRNPQGAERFRSTAARVSARLSVWAGYLPESWTSGLYLPDFAHPDDASEKLSGDPFDRLARDPQNQ